MARIVTLTLGLLLSFTLAACGTSGANVQANTNPTTPENTDGTTTDGGASTGTSKLKKAENGNMEKAEQDE